MRSRSSSSTRSTYRYRSSSSPTRAPRWRWSRTSSSAADGGAGRRRRHGHGGQDDDGVPPLRGAGGGRAAAGLLGTIETRVDGERRAATRTTAEAIDLQRLFREMLDAGDRSCAMEATSHGSALRRLDRVRFAALVFTNLDRDHLDFHGTWRTTSTRSGGCSRRRCAAGRSQRGRRIRPATRRRAARARHAAAHLRPDRRRRRRALRTVDVQSRAARPLQRRERARRAVAAARLLGIDDEAIRVGSGPSRRARPLRGRGRGAALRRDRRLRAHA